MGIITENWVFQNVMPWVGIWFFVMTVIYFVFLIYVYLKEKFWARTIDYCVDRTCELSSIISLVPFFLALLFLGIIETPIRKLIKRKGPRIIKLEKGYPQN